MNEADAEALAQSISNTLTAHKRAEAFVQDVDWRIAELERNILREYGIPIKVTWEVVPPGQSLG